MTTWGANGNASDEDPEPGTDSWWPVDLSTLAERPPLEPTLGGIGLLYPGKRHVWSGTQESAKTLAGYVALISVVRSGGRVVLIDFEMGRWDARNRLRELGATSEELPAVLYVEPSQPATAERIDALIARQPALVLVDAAAGAYDLQGLDDNKRQDVERFTRLYVTAFWRAGVATIVLDHVVKNSDLRGTYAIGSERKVGGADVHLGFAPVLSIRRGGRGLYKITTHKDRGGFLRRGHLADLALTSDPDTHAITWTLSTPAETTQGGGFRPTVIMDRVSNWLEKQKEPASGGSVEKAGLGRRAETVRQALALLVAEGYVTETAGPRNARLFSFKAAYKASEDPHNNPETPPRPTSSHLVPDEVNSPRPTSSPPYGDEDDGEGVRTSSPRPGFSDEVDDGIPF